MDDGLLFNLMHDHVPRILKRLHRYSSKQSALLKMNIIRAAPAPPAGGAVRDNRETPRQNFSVPRPPGSRRNCWLSFSGIKDKAAGAVNSSSARAKAGRTLPRLHLQPNIRIARHDAVNLPIFLTPPLLQRARR